VNSRIGVGRASNGGFFADLPESFLVVIEEALKEYRFRYYEELNAHQKCGTETGCLINPGGSCDGDLASLYGTLADIHDFLNRTQVARKLGVAPVVDGTVVVGASTAPDTSEAAGNDASFLSGDNPEPVSHRHKKDS
jgi:hypothetical protein